MSDPGDATIDWGYGFTPIATAHPARDPLKPAGI